MKFHAQPVELRLAENQVGLSQEASAGAPG